MTNDAVPTTPGARPRASNPWPLRAARLAVFAFVVGLTVWIYSLDDNTVASLGNYGYAGVFVLSILANATIILPAPGLALVFTFAGRLSPWGVGAAAAAGATLGELSGYLAGYSGQAIIDNRVLYTRFENYMRRYGPVTITVLAFLPLPVFDLAGVAAGVLRMPVTRFLFWCFLGKLPKMILIALAGTYSVGWIMDLLR